MTNHEHDDCDWTLTKKYPAAKALLIIVSLLFGLGLTILFVAWYSAPAYAASMEKSVTECEPLRLLYQSWCEKEIVERENRQPGLKSSVVLETRECYDSHHAKIRAIITDQFPEEHGYVGVCFKVTWDNTMNLENGKLFTTKTELVGIDDCHGNKQ